MKKDIFFVDAQKMHENHPETFWAPCQEELDTIKIGDVVKICANNKERFHVIVTEVNGDDMTGRVSDALVMVDLDIDEVVHFKKENIYDFYNR